jgi:sigma-B regulation protein RsbU (phosphoserine phosphatase)
VTPTAPVRILRVEDNPGDARLLRETLRDARSLDFRLVHAETLGQGMDAVTGEGCDVVLLDLSLPDAHGLQTVERMLAAAPTLPIMVPRNARVLVNEAVSGAASARWTESPPFAPPPRAA